MTEEITQVYVIVANNTADFSESDIVVAGTSREAAERQFNTVLKERWNEQLDQDDLDFYETFERYEDGWRYDWTVCGLAK